MIFIHNHKMLNLRIPVNFQTCLLITLRNATNYFNRTEYKELLKHVNNQDKIKTEKFRSLISFLQKMDEKSVEKHAVNLLEKPQDIWTSNRTNIVDHLPDTENSKSQDSLAKNKTCPPSVSNTEESLTCNPPLGRPIVLKAILYKDDSSSPVIMNSTDEKATIYHADLSTAALPLALHCRQDDSILMAGIVKDLNHLYYKTAENMDKCCIIIQNNGVLWYRTFDTFINKPGSLQHALMQHTLSLKNNTALWLTEGKPSNAPATPAEGGKPSEPAESPIDKIKKTIQDLLTSLKQKVGDQKKTTEEKK